MELEDRQTLSRKINRQSINGIAFYTLTLTNREAEVSWPALSAEETLKVGFT